LRLVRELLWVLEQPEAAGYTQLALAGVSALGQLVPMNDLRSGYVLAQSARAVRTLGNLPAAIERYVLAEKLGEQSGSNWLRARGAIGLGTTHAYAGNYPAARTAFYRVLEGTPVDPYLTAAAHHGLLVSAMAAEDWDTALKEGWHLLHAEESGSLSQPEVLNLMAELCLRIGRYGIAVRAAEAALRSSTRPDIPVASLAILVDAAVAGHDRDLGRRYGAALRDQLGGNAGPFEDARALISLAALQQLDGSVVQAMDDLRGAVAIASTYGYHEIRYKAEEMIDLLARNETLAHSQTSDVTLTEGSHAIVSRLDVWDGYNSLTAATLVR
jgi:tetratricopeptide (TPR) repeat protein